jgi:hypothetical protein
MCKVVENMAKLSIESQIAKYEHTADFCKQKADRCWAYAKNDKGDHYYEEARHYYEKEKENREKAAALRAKL